MNGDYPDIMKKNTGNRIPSFTKLESEMIKGSFDFFGINHYNTIQIKDNPTSLEMDIRDFGADMAATLICMPCFYDTTVSIRKETIALMLGIVFWIYVKRMLIYVCIYYSGMQIMEA